MLKKLLEKKNKLLDEMDRIVAACETETRAMNETEAARFSEMKAEVEQINATVAAAEEARSFDETRCAGEPSGKNSEEAEIRAFAQFIRTAEIPETRAGESNFTMGSNGAIVPSTIAGMILKKVVERCPILAGATVFHTKGTLKIPIYGKDGENDITVSYSSDFTELTENAGKFTSVDLTGYLVGALSLVGKTLLNSADVALVSFVVNEMSEKIATFIERELLVGTENKCTGALSASGGITAASASAITADELVGLQASVKQTFQNGACWTMNSATFTAIKTLKDGNGRYLLQDDVTQEFPYRLLGKPVYLSDSMPKIAAGAKPILYGDYSGLAVNLREDISIQILQEKYATQHAIGVIGWLELDSKIMDEQRLAVLKMKAS